MKSAPKLRSKLEHGTITARELRTLLRQQGWSLDRTRGSHEVWVEGDRTFVLATHGEELKQYQIRVAQTLLLSIGETEL